MDISRRLSLTFALVQVTFACMASYNPDIPVTTIPVETTTVTIPPTTTTLACPCMAPSTDTSAECRAPIFGPSTGVPQIVITPTNDPNMPCTAYMIGCSQYRIVTGGRCNNPVDTFPTDTQLPLICMGGPYFLGPVNPVEKVDCVMM